GHGSLIRHVVIHELASRILFLPEGAAAAISRTRSRGLQLRKSAFSLTGAVGPGKSPNRSGGAWSARSQWLAPFDFLSRGGHRICPGHGQRRCPLRCRRPKPPRINRLRCRRASAPCARRESPPDGPGREPRRREDTEGQWPWGVPARKGACGEIMIYGYF